MLNVKKLRLVVVTPSGKFYEGYVDFVVVHNSDGERGIFPNRAPFVGAIYPGPLRFRIEDEWSYAFVSNGYTQIGHDYVIVICNAAEWAGRIDVERAKRNIQKNEQRLQEKKENVTITEKNIYERSIQRNKKRLAIFEAFEKRKEHDDLQHEGLSPKAEEAQRALLNEEQEKEDEI